MYVETDDAGKTIHKRILTKIRFQLVIIFNFCCSINLYNVHVLYLIEVEENVQ